MLVAIVEYSLAVSYLGSLPSFKNFCHTEILAGYAMAHET